MLGIQGLKARDLAMKFESVKGLEKEKMMRKYLEKVRVTCFGLGWVRDTAALSR